MEGSRAGSETLRWILLQVAQVAARCAPAARAYYQRLRIRKRPQVAKVALAHKLLSCMWALLRHGVCYDDQVFAAQRDAVQKTAR
jgi:transposase